MRCHTSGFGLEYVKGEFMEHENEIAILCKNIKRIRNEKGLSQSKMAEKLNIGVKSLSMLENGILPPRLSVEILFRFIEQ